MRNRCIEKKTASKAPDPYNKYSIFMWRKTHLCNIQFNCFHYKETIGILHVCERHNFAGVWQIACE